ncbi:MAG: ribosome-associated translation inhibitor RaiA [bacterium]|nr:ribosome-associated translation inhibitor RaiA [bacterium]
MKLVVKGVSLTVTPSLRRYVDEKLVRTVEKLLGRHPAYEAAALELELIHGTRHHKKGKVWEAVVNFQLPGKHVWQHATGEDIHAAIDELEDHLKRELTKYKERSRSRELRGARQAKKDLRFSRSARFYRKGRIRQEGI